MSQGFDLHSSRGISRSVGRTWARGSRIRDVFTVEDRDRLRDWVVGMASSDRRVVAGAVLGSLAHDEGDRWSDLDLMFAVADDVPVRPDSKAGIWSRSVDTTRSLPSFSFAENELCGRWRVVSTAGGNPMPGRIVPW